MKRTTSTTVAVMAKIEGRYKLFVNAREMPVVQGMTPGKKLGVKVEYVISVN